ncbi:MAG: CotH kinase family protein [Bacteroidales bacterium]|nr:CotH kinase family protein [Bacteroidales bacterium]
MKIYLLIICVFFWLIIIKSYSQDLVVNEMMAINETTITDEDGDYSDWIELFNFGTESINLFGYYITDDSTNLDKWTFPDLEIKSDSFLLIFASEKDRIEGPYLHTNFKIDAEGEQIILSDSLENIIDIFPEVYLTTDISYGRRPDAGNELFYFDHPSPGYSNTFSNSLQFSHQRGYYTSQFKLGIISNAIGNEIYYTLDGSIPNINSNLYTDSIQINYRHNEPNVYSEIPTTPDSAHVNWIFWKPPEGFVDKITTIRARSFNGTIPTSKVYNHTFLVDSNIFSKYPYPVVSLITDSGNLFNYDTGIYVPGVHWSEDDPWWTGNYYQTSDDWERDIHIEYFNMNGQLEFYQNAGMRIHGKRTRRRPQKNLRMYARKEYGSQYFNFQLLPQRDSDRYKRFLLYTTMGSMFNTIIEDVMTHDLIRHFEIDIMEYRPVILFINGEYWGIHTIRDYQNENYLAQNYDIDESSIDLLKDNSNIVYGTNEDYITLTDFIENNDLSVQSNYYFVASKIDINNFIDYQITEIFFKNYDWPGSNIKYWRSSQLDEKWRWIFFDIDSGYGDYEYNMLEHATLEGGTEWPNPDWSTLFLRKLLENEIFEELFITRFADVLNTTFQTDSVVNQIESFTSLYEQDIDRHIARWHYPASKSDWLNNIQNRLYEFTVNRPCIMQDHIMEFFDLDEFGFNCDTTGIIINRHHSIKVYPNPNNGVFKFEIDKSKNNKIQIDVLDCLGNCVYSNEHLINEKGNMISMDLSYLSNGLYILTTIFDNRHFSKKIILQK